MNKHRIRKIIGSIPISKEFKQVIRKHIIHADTVLNVGCGTTTLSDHFDLPKEQEVHIINTDAYDSPVCHRVCEAHNLPKQFKHKFDLVVNVALLEHVANPTESLKGMVGVLKPGGRIITVVPFLQQFHSFPNDFQRWTNEGLRVLLQGEGLQVEQVGVYSGATSTLRLLFSEFFTLFTPYPNVNRVMKGMVLLGTLPFKLLEPFIMKRNRFVLPCTIYAVAKKDGG